MQTPHFCDFTRKKYIKPPWEPQGHQRYHIYGRGTTAIQMKKKKTTSVNRHVDDHNTTGIEQVSIRNRFRPDDMLTYSIPVVL